MSDSTRMEMLTKTISKTLANVCVLDNTDSAYFTLEFRSVSPNKDGSRQIMNFSGCTEYQMREIAKGIRAHGSISDMSEEQLQEVANNNMTYGFPTDWLSSDRVPYIPQKGEMVKVLIHKIKNSEGVMIDVIKTVAPLPIATKKSMSIDDILNGVESEEEVIDEAQAIVDEVVNP